MRELTVEDIPEVLSRQTITENNHIARLYEEEVDMSSVIFANDDSTNSLYVFPEAIKYADEDGIVKDKTSRLYEISSDARRNRLSSDDLEKYAYANLDNDIRTLFPREISSETGVRLATPDYTIELSPAVSLGRSAEVELYADKEGYVYYDGIFGEHTALRYTTMFSGFKGDVVLERNVGNEFAFILRTGGLIPQYDPIGRHINLIDPNVTENDGIVGEVAPIYVYDSADKGEVGCIPNSTLDNEMRLVKRDDGDWDLVVVACLKFLTDERTVYPVYVDPQFSMNTLDGRFQSLPIYNGAAVQNQSMASETFSWIGNRNATYGNGRLVMRFPGINNHEIVRNLPANNITNVTLVFETLKTHAAIDQAYYTGNANWTVSTPPSQASFNGIGGSSGSAGFSTTPPVSAPHMTGFNITAAVRYWKGKSPVAINSRSQGLIFFNTDNPADEGIFPIRNNGTFTAYATITYLADLGTFISRNTNNAFPNVPNNIANTFGTNPTTSRIIT